MLRYFNLKSASPHVEQSVVAEEQYNEVVEQNVVTEDEQYDEAANQNFTVEHDEQDDLVGQDEQAEVVRDEEERELDANTHDYEQTIGMLPSDPGLRTPIMNFDVNIQDEVRRAYVQRGPCQPRNHMFPTKTISLKDRRFSGHWFNEYKWLEYSISKDAAFCFYCYLFKANNGDDAFVSRGFSNWALKQRFQKHVGKTGSAHNQARVKYEAFKNIKQNIVASILKQSDQVKNEYRVRLISSINCVRFLLRQGLAFRGHDETETSKNQGNFLELLQFLCEHNEDVKAVSLRNAPKNLKLTSPDVQKDIVSAAAFETTNLIINDIGEENLYSILVDESRDMSMKEQMSVVLRYVKNGRVIERFIGIEHVSNTSALSLKAAIDHLFSKHNLSISRLRGQGFDGASNMKGEYNGLKALILKENSSAFYIHCFAHQLQLALVAVANKHPEIETFFYLVSSVLNVVGGSAKRSDLLREKKRLKVFEAISCGDLLSGRGLNQETSLKRPGDTRWGSHYDSLVNLILMFKSTIEVVEIVAIDATSSGKRGEACALLQSMVSFQFIFNLHLMKRILGFTDDLSKALQRKDQDIVNAMRLVKLCKERLQSMRNNEWEWDKFLATVCSFCVEHKIDIPNMDEMFTPLGRSRRATVKNLQHYRVDLFNEVIALQDRELEDRFTEANSDLLLCIACLCPNNSFSAFNICKLIKLSKYYPRDFSPADVLIMEEQLGMYILDMHTNEDFTD